MFRLSGVVLGVALGALAASASGCRAGPVALPYRAADPVIYDNDSAEDVYTDELVMALQTAHRIDLRGLVTTIGGWKEEPWSPNEVIVRHAISARRELAAKARRSGMPAVPVPVDGVMTELVRPASGRIADTTPLRTPGARLIVAEAHRASPDHPLVILAGGPVSTVADAFLIDPTIADRVVVAWSAGDGWNGQAAPFRWATEIVLRHFRCVLFCEATVERSAPLVEKKALTRLPDTELRQFMIDKALPHVDLPNRHDYDSPPVIPLIADHYVQEVRRYRWSGSDGAGRAVLVPDLTGPIWCVERASRRVATRAWWQAMTDPRAWGAEPRAVAEPFAGRPGSIPGRIEAVKFDEGGPGVAYFDTDLKHFSENLQHPITSFRVLEHVDFARDADTGTRYCVTRTEPGEWMAYTVDVSAPGTYRVVARVAAAQPGGAIRVDFDGTRMIDHAIPSSGDPQAWESVDLGEVHLRAGRQGLRIGIERGGFELNWLEFQKT